MSSLNDMICRRMQKATTTQWCDKRMAMKTAIMTSPTPMRSSSFCSLASGLALEAEGEAAGETGEDGTTASSAFLLARGDLLRRLIAKLIHDEKSNKKKCQQKRATKLSNLMDQASKQNTFDLIKKTKNEASRTDSRTKITQKKCFITNYLVRILHKSFRRRRRAGQEHLCDAIVYIVVCQIDCRGIARAEQEGGQQGGSVHERVRLCCTPAREQGHQICQQQVERCDGVGQKGEALWTRGQARAQHHQIVAGRTQRRHEAQKVKESGRGTRGVRCSRGQLGRGPLAQQRRHQLRRLVRGTRALKKTKQ